MAQPRTWDTRRSPRLAGYDYRQPGLYFVTVCTQHREPLLGDIIAAEMRPSSAGRAVTSAWHALPHRFPSLALDAFVLMPNHVHGILLLGTDPNLPPDTPAPTLAAILRAFKSVSAIEATRLLDRPGQPLWQRSYHDHIIRHDRALHQIRRYIEDNPARWDTDPDNPNTTSAKDAPVS